MDKKGDRSPCKKAEVKAFVNAKMFSNHEISRRLKISEASVRRIKRSGVITPPRGCALQFEKHCPTKIMIWSVISGKGTERLYVVKGMMRQDQYKDVFQNRLIPQLEEWFPNGEPYIFMQDGAPCHTARSIKAFWQNKISLC
ncbi:uncharacterized protein TNCV_1547211 [Trichonephila clavipes]|nr:uncharacterized protein TNCV_1547211 [Trichonephila clavipes]